MFIVFSYYTVNFRILLSNKKHLYLISSRSIMLDKLSNNHQFFLYYNIIRAYYQKISSFIINTSNECKKYIIPF
jgi:hypothetical protein